MSYFEWNDNLSVHDVLIDQDHKTLINMVNELHDAAELEQDYLSLSKILTRLATYTLEHFQREEDLMQASAYPVFKAHREQHRKLLERVTDLKHELENARTLVALETAELLRFWLTSHILLSDKQFAEFLHQLGPQATLEDLPST